MSIYRPTGSRELIKTYQHVGEITIYATTQSLKINSKYMINMMQSSFDTLLLLQDSTPLRIDGNGHGQCRVYEGLGRDMMG